MIDFPNSPTVGQTVATPEGTQWSWDGSVWKMIASATGGSTTIEIGPRVGTIMSFSGDTIPADCLVCNGQAVPAGTAYDALRAIVGANVPDLRDRFLHGASATRPLRSVGGAATHTLVPGEMPSHTHIQDAHNHDFFYGSNIPSMPYSDVGSLSGGLKFFVSTTSYGSVSIAAKTPTNQYTGGNGAHNNMPPYYAVVFIIQAVARTAQTGGAVGPAGPQGPAGIATREAGSWQAKYEGASSTYANGTDILNVVVPMIAGHRYLILGRAECIESAYAGGRYVGIQIALIGLYTYGTAIFPSVNGNTLAQEVVLMRTFLCGTSGAQNVSLRIYNSAGGGVWVTGGPYGGGPEINVIDVTYI